VVLDSADAIDDNSGAGDDESYLNLRFFLPDAPTVDVIITTRHAGVAEMTTLAGFARHSDEAPLGPEWAPLGPGWHLRGIPRT
jgi:hypothetical protein